MAGRQWARTKVAASACAGADRASFSLPLFVCSAVQEAPLAVHECRLLMNSDFGRDTCDSIQARRTLKSEPFSPKARTTMVRQTGPRSSSRNKKRRNHHAATQAQMDQVHQDDVRSSGRTSTPWDRFDASLATLVTMARNQKSLPQPLICAHVSIARVKQIIVSRPLCSTFAYTRQHSSLPPPSSQLSAASEGSSKIEI